MMDEMVVDRFKIIEKKAQLARAKQREADRVAREAQRRIDEEIAARKIRMAEYATRTKAKAGPEKARKRLNLAPRSPMGPPKNGASIRKVEATDEKNPCQDQA